MHTTVKELVDKRNAMKSKLDDLLVSVDRLQGRTHSTVEIMDKARKDERYSVKLLVHEYDRVKAELAELEESPVRLLRD